MSTNLRKAQKHMQRAKELLSPESQLGFGVDPKPSTPSIEYWDAGNEVTGIQDNVRIIIQLKKNKWNTDDDHYQLKEPVRSNLNIGEMTLINRDTVRTIDKNQIRKKLLCYLLGDLIKKKRATLDMVVSADVDVSPNYNLIKNVFNPLGFELKGKLKLYDTGGLMTSTVQKIITFCEEAERSEVSKKRDREDDLEGPRKKLAMLTQTDILRELHAQSLINIRLVSMNPNDFFSGRGSKDDHRKQWTEIEDKMEPNIYKLLSNIDITLMIQSIKEDKLQCIFGKDNNGNLTKYFDKTMEKGTNPLRKGYYSQAQVEVFNRDVKGEYFKIQYYRTFFCVIYGSEKLDHLINRATSIADFETGHNECSDKTVMQCHADCWIVAVSTLLIKLPWLLKHLDEKSKEWISKIYKTMRSDMACASFPPEILEDYNKGVTEPKMSSIKECGGSSYELLKAVLNRGYLKKYCMFNNLISGGSNLTEQIKSGSMYVKVLRIPVAYDDIGMDVFINRVSETGSMTIDEAKIRLNALPNRTGSLHSSVSVDTMIKAITLLHSGSKCPYVVCGGFVNIFVNSKMGHVFPFTVCYEQNGRNYPVFCNYGNCYSTKVHGVLPEVKGIGPNSKCKSIVIVCKQHEKGT